MLAQFESGSRVILPICKKCLNNLYRGRKFIYKNSYLKNLKTVMSPEKVYSQLVEPLLFSIFHILSRIYPSLYLCGSGSIFRIGIRIHKVTEYGSNVDPAPDPHH